MNFRKVCNRRFGLINLAVSSAVTFSTITYLNSRKTSKANCDESNNNNEKNFFLNNSFTQVRPTPVSNISDDITDGDYKKLLNDFVVISGSSSLELTNKICKLIGKKRCENPTAMFSDGEIYPKINESVRGLDVYIIQSCSNPVNNSIMELLLLSTAARRADASNVIVVVPYLGYKYHRRGLPISTTLKSRFLWSSAGDIAKMLEAVGVDRVISMDLQRPGQGHEACFFDTQIPVESVMSEDVLCDYFATQLDVPLQSPTVIVSPNSQFLKKAQRFQHALQKKLPELETDYAVFLHDFADLSRNNAISSEFLGDVHGADVIIVDDLVDTAGTLSTLCRRLRKGGARRVFICASHGVFSQNSMELIDLSPVEKVVVTDSLALPPRASKKIVQVSIAPIIARVIEADVKNNLGTSTVDELHVDIE